MRAVAAVLFALVVSGGVCFAEQPRPKVILILDASGSCGATCSTTDRVSPSPARKAWTSPPT